MKCEQNGAEVSGAQPVYRVTLTTVYYFHPRYVVAVDQQTGTVLSVERSA